VTSAEVWHEHDTSRVVTSVEMWHHLSCADHVCSTCSAEPSFTNGYTITTETQNIIVTSDFYTIVCINTIRPFKYQAIYLGL